ncbi:glycopeptide antibiotics resistance protein [Alkalicoccobacillus murimartini]|uniref:Glycopeptide antibiotics resistance protein n=2 Tax=Alkalicoccobacillus murimartini TaxID=171685 RepID=A0ABT9YL70_9BACI|nr:glycopeptide antibiotics resistance protein [Alkalicoccobacillus murimartini]
MENIEKNILALVIVITTIFIFIRMVLNVEITLERYIIFIFYLVVLVLGLLRPDNIYSGESAIALNPFGFLNDIKGDKLSLIIMLINLIIFVPMFFLLAKLNYFRGSFLFIFIFFEVFVFIIEYLQYKMDVGVFDLSDIFLYNVSFFIGYIFWLVYNKIRKKFI